MNVHAPPPAPNSIKEAGVGHKLLFDLMLKIMHVEGLNTVTMLAARSRLPAALVADLVEEAREFALLESRGTRGSDYSAELRYALTGKGHDWAIEALERCQYLGPAPVSLEAFREQVEKQRIARERVGPERIMRSFAHLVLPEQLLARGKRQRDTEAATMNMQLVTWRDGRAANAALAAGTGDALRTWRQP